MANIPAGFRLAITSWENDGDHYKDQVFDGLTAGDVQYLVVLASLFKIDRFGGGLDRRTSVEEFWADLKDAIIKVVAAHQDVSEGIRERFMPELDDDWQYTYTDIASELLSYPGEGYDYTYFRVFDSFKVHLIVSEIKDVTNSFSALIGK